MALGGAAAAASATINGGTNGDLVCAYNNDIAHSIKSQHKSDQLKIAKYLLKRALQVALHYI